MNGNLMLKTGKIEVPGDRYMAPPPPSRKGDATYLSPGTTILIKSGVGEEEMKSLESNIEGINTGFQTITPKPWTKDEQEKALEEKGKMNRFKAL